MANFVDVIGKIVRPYKRYMLIITLIILFIIIGYFGVKWFKKPRDYSDVANANRRNNNVEILLFTVDWCPHCKNAMPEWVAFQNTYNGQTMNNYDIICTNIDCTDETNTQTQMLVGKYNIESYPTVIMLKNGETIGYDAKITNDSLTQFIETLTK